MQDALQIYSSDEFGDIRTLTKDNEPWFVGKDVARALGYANTRDAILTHIDGEDRTVSQIATPSRGVQETTIINESGLYSLILSSKLPSAKRFKRWVTSSVLPMIRKTGAYISGEVVAELRPLTTEDYLSAARTVAMCNKARLPIVLNLLERAGICGLKLEQLNSVVKVSRPVANLKDTDIAERIQNVLSEKGWCLRELAEALGCCYSEGVLYAYCHKHRHPRKERYEALVEALDQL